MTNKDEVLFKLKEIAPALKVKYYLLNIYLFGSVARGEQDAHDIDILIDYYEIPTLFTLVELKMVLEEQLQAKVDLICKKGLSSEFTSNIEDDLIAV